MRKISIIGGGQAGLLLGFSLLDKGCSVSLYTDRSAEQVLNSRIPSTAFMFDSSLAVERELGLNFWEDLVPYGEGMHVDFRGPDGSIGLTVQGIAERAPDRLVVSPGPCSPAEAGISVAAALAAASAAACPPPLAVALAAVLAAVLLAVLLVVAAASTSVRAPRRSVAFMRLLALLNRL